MTSLYPLMLSSALAQDPVVPAPSYEAAPVEMPPSSSYDDALHLVDQMIDEQAWAEARSLLGWLLQPGVPEDVAARARTRLAALPRTGDAAARLRLLPWQTVMGAWMLGPNMQWMMETRGNYNSSPLLVFTGAIAGGAGGVAASLLYKRDEGLSHGQVTAILHSQQLALLHGAWLTTGLPDGDQWELACWGLLGGSVAGSAAGYALAERPLRDGEMSAARAGSMLLPGFTMLTMGALDPDGEFWAGEPLHDAAPFVLAADAGTALGWLAGRTFNLRRVDAQMVTLGAVAGAGVGAGLAAATVELVLWSPSGVYATTELFALGGGVLGYVLAHGFERPLPVVQATALLSGTDEAPRLGLPLPSVAPAGRGWNAHVQLVDLRF